MSCEKDSKYISRNSEDIKKELVFGGPMYTVMRIYDDFLLYKSGIYYPIVRNQSNYYPYTPHSVILIGFGYENGVLYWTAANLWGPKWGENGYFRIQDDSSVFNLEAGACKPAEVTEGFGDFANGHQNYESDASYLKVFPLFWLLLTIFFG